MARINKEEEKLNLELTRLNGMLSNQGFLTKAPANKVEEIKNRVNELTTMLDNLSNQKENILSL